MTVEFEPSRLMVDDDLEEWRDITSGMSIDEMLQKGFTKHRRELARDHQAARIERVRRRWNAKHRER